MTVRRSPSPACACRPRAFSRRGALLVGLFAAGLLVACRAEAPLGGPEGDGSGLAGDVAPAGAGDGAGVAGEPLAPAFEGALAGRIVVIAADDAIDDPTNVAWAFDPERGEGRRLWRTEEPEVLEWRAAPVGAAAAYRESWHAEPKTEALAARGLAEEAEADYLVLLDAEIARLAGHVWAPGGDALAYGRQLGAPAAFAGGEALSGWELRALSVGGSRMTSDSNDRVLWRVPEETLAGWSPRLLAWDPAAGRALLSATPIDGAFAQELWSVPLGGGGLERIVPETPAREVRSAPAGEAVAWLDVDGVLRLLDAADGAERAAWPALGSVADGFATRVLWSTDGRWLAWTVFGAEAEGGERSRVWLAEATAPDRPPWEVRLANASAQALAFGPEGSLLLGAGPPGADELLAALVVDPTLDHVAAFELGWSLPRGTWDVAWIVDVETSDAP